MTKILDNILKSNKEYSEELKKQDKLPHGAKFAIVTCMDERIDPVQIAGLKNNAHVIRNAGGRVTDDVIRSLIISHKLLGTQEWYIIQHTDCGAMTFTNDKITELLSESLETAEYGEDGWYNPIKEGGSKAGEYINFLPISNIETTVTEDVRRIKNHPLVPSNIPIYGYIYQIETGKLIKVEEACKIGTNNKE